MLAFLYPLLALPQPRLSNENSALALSLSNLPEPSQRDAFLVASASKGGSVEARSYMLRLLAVGAGAGIAGVVAVVAVKKFLR